MRSSLLKQMLLLPSALLAASLAFALDVRDASTTTTIVAPLAISPDQDWDGIDGTWSTFTLRVGTPAQYVRTLLSFNAYQTWVVLPQGCAAAASVSTCEQARGGVFNISQSSTWDPIGLYDLWILSGLGYTGNAQYGYDTVGLGGQGDGGPTVKNTTVGGLAVEDFYLGNFGVNPKPTNFTSFNDPSPSYMTLLKEQKSIPSISFGYTAGAKYRYTGVLASLTLGGYDTSKFIENDVEFIFAPDNGRDIVVAVQSISTPSRDASQVSGTSLLPNPIYAYIDATIPHLWLPIEACRAFEIEFGLEYDNKTQLYLVNQTLHQALTTRNPNVTFTLAQGLTGGATVQITLPYAAFDLTAQPPYQGLSNNSYYFPLQRAQNDTQYTIGRAFLQESYLTIDYERERFNVSQVSWVQNPTEHLVAIPPYNGDSTSSGSSGTSSGSNNSSSSGISTGAIAGIAVVAAVLGLALFGVLFWYCRRRRATKNDNEKSTAHGDTRDVRGLHETVYPKAELEGSTAIPDNRKLLSAEDSSNSPVTPHSMLPPSSSGSGPGSGAGSGTNRNRYSSTTHYSPTTPSADGTYLSAGNTLPFSPLSATRSEDSLDYHIYEMPGDQPRVGEADGRELSEKEAINRRNEVYNGVSSATNSSSAVDEGLRTPRRISARDVVRASSSAITARRAESSPLEPPQSSASHLHRAFSFEMAPPDSKREVRDGGYDRELYE